MLNLYDFEHMTIEKKRRWEISHSSLARLKNATYDECRAYACQSISDGMTKVSVKKGEIVEIPYGVPFNFIGRIDTSRDYLNPESYYNTYMRRTFISYSTIYNQNVSHYKASYNASEIFLLYDICPEDIVHIFPIDSDTDQSAVKESELTRVPSVWITLSELNALSKRLGVYNQVTMRAKRNVQVIKPFAVAAFDKVDNHIQKIADLFDIGIIIIHPDKNAVNYSEDLLYDWYTFHNVSKIIEKLYGLSIASLYHTN